LSSYTPLLDLGVLSMKKLEVGLAEVEIVHKNAVCVQLDKKVFEASTNFLARGGTAWNKENTPSIRVDDEGE
jgi:hypothetical protein